MSLPKLIAPTIAKIILPIILMLLALFHNNAVSVVLFELFALPFGSLLNPWRMTGITFLDWYGVLIVAFVWAVVLYLLAALLSVFLSKIKALRGRN